MTVSCSNRWRGRQEKVKNLHLTPVKEAGQVTGSHMNASGSLCVLPSCDTGVGMGLGRCVDPRKGFHDSNAIHLLLFMCFFNSHVLGKQRWDFSLIIV